MFVNSEITFYLGTKKIAPLKAYKVQSFNAELSTAGLQRGISTTFFIPEKENAGLIKEIKSIPQRVKTGTDYIEDENQTK